MKKALYILIGIVSMIVGVSGVSAEMTTKNVGSTFKLKASYNTGSCNLVQEGKGSRSYCRYRCTIGDVNSIVASYRDRNLKLDDNFTEFEFTDANSAEKIYYDIYNQELYIEAYNTDQAIAFLTYIDSNFNNSFKAQSNFIINTNKDGINHWLNSNNIFECYETAQINLDLTAGVFYDNYDNIYRNKMYLSGYDREQEYYIDFFEKEINDPSLPTDNLDNNNSCGMLGPKDGELVKILRQIYMYIKIIIPVLIIGLGIADLLKSLGTGKDDDLKKAINKFAKRIILAIVFILVPIIISILINISGVTSQYDKINDGIKSLFCIIE